MISIINLIKRSENILFCIAIVYFTIFFSQNDNLEKKYIMVVGTILILSYYIYNGIQSIPYREILLLFLFGLYSYIKFEGNTIVYIPALFVIFSLLGYLLGKRNHEKINRIRFVIYSLVIGYSFHMIMNGVYLIRKYTFEGGVSAVLSNRMWADYLSHNNVSATQHEIYYLPALALLGVVILEKNKKIKIACFSIFITALSLTCLSFTRTPFLILCIVFSIQISIYLSTINNKLIFRRLKKCVFVVLVALFVILIFICSNYSSIRNQKWYKGITYTVSRGGGITHNVRVFFWSQAISQMDDYPYGGNRMELHYVKKTDKGYQIDYDRKPPEDVHNVWLDVYNAEGYLPFVLIIIYTIITYIDLMIFIKNRQVDIKVKILMVGMFIAFQFTYMVEPVFNVSYQLLIPWVFMDGIMYGINEKSKQLSKVGNIAKDEV